MKTSKSVALDSSGSRRSQPPRTTRNNPPRSTISGARNFAPRGSISSGLEEAPIQIFPAITHFADAIAALPKELVRHFTLLKEVDAKIFLPEEDLTRLVNDALNAPLPQQLQPVGLQNCLDLSSASMSIEGSFNGSAMKYHAGSMIPVSEADAVWDSANVPRRQLFNRCAHTMQSMLTSLDEKNHVISTAGEALAKQIARIDDCFPHIEDEISEEARNGSRTHWAYAENRHPRMNTSASSRKETAANQLSAAAQQLADDVAARSDARKQALLEKKRGRNQHVDPDFEDQQDIKQKDKKLHGNTKVRRVLDAPAPVGIGITNGSTTNGNQPKRRKIEKSMAGSTVIERPISSVASANGAAAKGKPGSPQETPQPEGPKKRIRTAPAASNGNTSRKRNNTVTSTARSPTLASSPIRATFSEPKPFGKQSPPPTNGGRPPSVKGRRNSMQSNLEKRPPSIASTGHNYTAISDYNLTTVIQTRLVPEVRNLGREPNTEAQGEPKVDESKKNEVEIIAGAVLGNKRDISAKRELPDTNGDAVHTIQTATVTTTKSGRASKPSTLSIPSFPDAVRSRPSRNNSESTSSGKRSHKKGVGATVQLLADQNLGTEDVDKNEEEEEEDVEIDANEPRYCYCNNVSYGEMVGCDADGCKREWFHLACVGLKTAPKSNAKWYCDDCKKGKRSSSGR